MSVFSIDLYFAARGLPPSAVHTVATFLAESRHWRVIADLALLALFAGLYSVPMYALIQMRSAPSHRARIIAANNILNSLFIIASSLVIGVLLSAGFTIPQVFGMIGILNAVVAIYVFLLVPEYLIRFVAFVVARIVYRFKVRGDGNIPTEGAAILVSNHVSFIDPMLLMAASPRPIRFIMDHEIFRTPLLGWFFRLAKAIPIAPQKVDAQTYEQAFTRARQVLDEGDLLCIFPEGAISRDGELAEFKGGVMRLLAERPVPVVPIALQNLWGSFFSRVEGRAMAKPFRRGVFSRVGLVAGEPLAPQAVTPESLRERVGRLLAA